MMKNLWNFLFAVLLIFVWSAVPFGQAEANAGAALVKLGTPLKAVFSTTKTATGTTMITRLLNAEGKTVQTLVSEGTSASVLRNYLPSKLSKQMKAAAAPLGNKTQAFSIGRIMKEKLFTFPKESLGFLISLGGVMTYQLMFNEAHNPMAYQQLVQAQTDPVGQLAFYAFMVANGVVTEPLMTAMQNGKLNPRFGKYIPFFGMGVGSVASNIVHELGHAPNLMQCAKTMLTMNGLDPACDKVAETWNERGGAMGIANEWTPGLLSLLGSVVISGWIQSGAMAAAGAVKNYSIKRGIVQVGFTLTRSLSLKRVVTFAGIEIGTILAPGGAVGKITRVALQFAGFMTNLTLFTAVEEIIRRPIAFAYKNAWDQGPALRDFERKMIADIIRLKKSGWNPDPTKNPLTENSKEFEASLEEFQELMPLWRQTNTANILEAHANWEQKITNLSLTYKGAYNFYRDFLNHYREKNLGEFKEMYAKGEATSLLDRIAPLNGVTAAEVTEPLAYLTDPQMVQDVQMAKVKQVANHFRLGKAWEKRMPVEVGNTPLPKEQRKILNDIGDGLMSDDPMVVGRAIDDLICLQFVRSDMKCRYDLAPHGSDFEMFAKTIYGSLGEPRPLWRRGPVYLEAFNKIAEHKIIDETAVFRSTFQAAWAPFSTNTLRDSLMASMVFGPDIEKGEPVIHDVKGFQALFIPPRINNSPFPMARIKPIEPMMVPRIWDVPVIYEKDQKSIHYADNDPSKVYENAYEYLMKEGIRPSVMTADPQVFEGWWKGYAETALQKAWTDYEEKYQEIIKDLVSVLWRTQDSFVNRGTISNGVMESIKQEYNLYLLILGELLKDKLVATHQAVPEQLLSGPTPLDISNLPLRKNETDLYAFLRRTGNIDFSEIMRIQGVHLDEMIRHEGKQHFMWQDMVLKDFSVMESMLKQIKPVKIVRKGKQITVTTTNLPNSLFQMAGIASVETLKMVKNELFTNGPNNKLGVEFNKFEQKIIEICFKGLMSVGSEVHNLGVVSNAVSYVARSEGGLVTPRCVDKPATGLGGLGAQMLRQRLAGCE